MGFLSYVVNLPAKLGSALSANSLPVVIASDQNVPVTTTPASPSGKGSLTTISAASVAGTVLPGAPTNITGVRLYLNSADSVTFTIANSQPAQVGASPNNLTMANSNYDSTTAKFGEALAATNYGTTASSAVLAAVNAVSYTVEGWVKLTSVGASGAVAFAANPSFYVGVNASGVPFAGYHQGGSGVSLVGSAAITDGNWHWLALSVGPSGGVLLVDNTLAASSSTANGTCSAASFGVGPYGFGGNGTLNWPGEVDEVVIWNSQKYTGATTAPTTPYASGLANVIALYHLDGNGTDSAIAPTWAPSFTVSGSVTGPNWDEPLSAGQQVYISAYSGSPAYRFM